MKTPTRSLRSLRLSKSYLPHAEGSCLVSMGETQVLCVASVEESVPPHAEKQGTGWVHAEYAMLPRAGENRSSRHKVTSGGRVQEISRLVGRSLRAAVDLTPIVGRTITVDCDVLRADGGTRTASVNGGFVAMVQSLLFLHRQGVLPVWPVKRFVAAVSIGVHKGKPVLDMCYEEDKEAETDLNVVMAEDGRLIEIQGTAEREPFSQQELAGMLALARTGIRQIIRAQKKVLGKLPTND